MQNGETELSNEDLLDSLDQQEDDFEDDFFKPLTVAELTELIETDLKLENPDVMILGSLYDQRGGARDWDSDFIAAEEDYIRAIELLESINDDFDRCNQLNYLQHAYECLGNLYCYTKQNEKADRTYTKGIECDGHGSVVNLLYKRGVCALKEGHFAEALQDFSAAISKGPNNWKLLMYRGICYFHLEEFQNAICDFTEALLTESKDLSELNEFSRKFIQTFSCFSEMEAKHKAEILELRAQCFEQLDRFDEALADYDQAISIHPDDGWLYYLRGKCHADKAFSQKHQAECNHIPVDHAHAIIEYSQAIEDFSRALEFGSDTRYARFLSSAYLSRALAYEKENQSDLAISDLCKCLTIDRETDDVDYTYVYNTCGRLLMEYEAYDKAVLSFNKLILTYSAPFADNDITLEMALNMRGIAYCKLGDYDQALADHYLAIKLAPHSPYGYCSLGEDYSAMGQYEKAIENYTLAINIDEPISQNGSYTLSQRSKAYGAIGEEEKAQEDLKLAQQW